MVLAACPLSESHAATYLVEKIEEVLTRYGIEKCRLVGITADGAPKIMLQPSRWKHEAFRKVR